MAAESTPFPTSTTSDPPASTDRLSDNDADSALGAHAERDGAAAAEDLIARIAQSAHQAIDRLAETAAPYLHPLQEGVSSAGESLHMRADRARQTTDEWAESLRCTVRESPLAAVGVALAVGLLVARLAR